MGVCCSKDSVVKLKELSGEKTDNNTLLLQENVGEVSKLNRVSDLNEADLPHVPLIDESKQAQTLKAEAINFYKEEQPAVRSTLIFPSYTGYKNQDRFGVSKKIPDEDAPPTALVSPVQATNLYSSLQVDNLTPKMNSPLPSRYSPMLRKDKYYRSRPGGLAARSFPTRRGSVESGGFDSDLESRDDDDEVRIVDEDPSKQINSASLTSNYKHTSNMGTDTEDRKQPTSNTSTQKNVSLDISQDNWKQNTTSAGIQTANAVVQMVDASVGTDSDKFYRSKKTTEVQVDLKKKMKTSSTSAGTDTGHGPATKTSHDMMVGTEPALIGTASSETGEASTNANLKKTYVKMVDASVGTDSDKFYRSKKTTKVQADLKKKQVKTSSTSVGTDPAFNFLKDKTTHDMMVGIEFVPVDSSSPKKSDAGTATDKQKSYIKMVDASVGTDSDEFYRSKTSRKVQVDKKKKKMATLSTGIGTSTDSSPRALRKPKIVTEIQVTPPQKRKVSKTDESPTPSKDRLPEKKEEPHPIIETLENAFVRFAKYGDINGDGLEMNNKNWAKLCRDCEFINNKHVLVGDIDVIFSRHKQKGYRLINFEMFLNCLNEIADKTYSHKIKNEWARRELIYQRVIGKAPELVGITNISKTGNVDRMTDHNLYPVSHKMRFDEEGKGTGIEEKFEVDDAQMGYVQGYKDRDTYDLKMMGLTRERSGINMTSSRLPSPRSPKRPRSSQSIRN